MLSPARFDLLPPDAVIIVATYLCHHHEPRTARHLFGSRVVLSCLPSPRPKQATHLPTCNILAMYRTCSAWRASLGNEEQTIWKHLFDLRCRESPHPPFSPLWTEHHCLHSMHRSALTNTPSLLTLHNYGTTRATHLLFGQVALSKEARVYPPHSTCPCLCFEGSEGMTTQKASFRMYRIATCTASS